MVEEVLSSTQGATLNHLIDQRLPADSELMGDRMIRLQGANNPSGKGRIPNITPDHLDWSLEEIVEYLYSGFTPDFDVAGGQMAAVVENTSQLYLKDREMIAQYLINLKN